MLSPSYDEIVRAPKVLLHDHLDGGLRPATVLELAAEIGHQLPADGTAALAQWFTEACGSGSLERYLETFVHTVGVMQTEPALRRVAYECARDLAADGVVYAEVRFAPEQHLTRGLTLDQVVAAVLAGFAEGSADAAAEGTPIRVATLLTAMRHQARSMEIAELAVRYRDSGVVGFDIAGAEAGYPPTRPHRAVEYRQRVNIH
jgi:adenosine deaminase